MPFHINNYRFRPDTIVMKLLEQYVNDINTFDISVPLQYINKALYSIAT